MNINITIPQDWNALSFTQIENIASALHYNRVLIENKHNADEVNTATYITVAKELLRGNDFKTIRAALKELHPRAYVPYTSFIFEGSGLHKFPEKINHLLGPKFRLKNISIAELSFADALYYRWHLTLSTAYLNRLCATLYRPMAKNTNHEDLRVPFSKTLAEEHADSFNQVPFKKRLAIAIAFEGTRNYMVNQFPMIFPKPPKTTHKENKKTTPAKKYVPFGKLIAAKIDYDPFKLETTEKMNAYKFLSLYETELREIKNTPKK